MARWLGSWLFREKADLYHAKAHSRIIPMARIRPKMKSLRLLITVNGSLAAKAVVVQQHSMSTRAVVNGKGAFCPFCPWAGCGFLSSC